MHGDPAVIIMSNNAAAASELMPSTCARQKSGSLCTAAVALTSCSQLPSHQPGGYLATASSTVSRCGVHTLAYPADGESLLIESYHGGHTTTNPTGPAVPLPVSVYLTQLCAASQKCPSATRAPAGVSVKAAAV